MNKDEILLSRVYIPLVFGTLIATLPGGMLSMNKPLFSMVLIILVVPFFIKKYRQNFSVGPIRKYLVCVFWVWLLLGGLSYLAVEYKTFFLFLSLFITLFLLVVFSSGVVRYASDVADKNQGR